VTEAAAKSLGIKLQSQEVRSLDDFESAFARAKKERSQALITTPGPLVATQQRQVLDFAAESRLPAMYSNSEFVEAGGLMSYAPNYMDLFQRTADLVDTILKGAKTADASHRPTEEVRIHHQSESRQADRAHDSAQCAGASRQSDSVIVSCLAVSALLVA
jgi:ABC-type uncharacterized transport system substrate-binding protein